LYIRELEGRIVFLGKSTLFQVPSQYGPDGQAQLFVPEDTKSALTMPKKGFTDANIISPQLSIC
jgi:hypothetical protein